MLNTNRGATLTTSRSEEEKALMARAIRLAEGHHNREAQEVLAKLLKHNPHLSEAWLWYCRTSVNLSTIDYCLQEVKKSGTVDLRLAFEISTFNAIQKKQPQNETFRRCPFCWVLFETKFSHCPKCRAFLTIEGIFLASRKYADEDELQKAIARYQQVIEREIVNLNAHYFLAVAYINLEMWEKGITHLSKASEISPDDHVLSEQLNILLKYLASGNPFASGDQPAVELKQSGLSKGAKTILVVEDSVTIRKVVATTLSQIGYRILEAGSGLEALSKLNQTKPDLILLDIILPGMNGYDILGAIRKNNELKQIPIVMLTSKDKFRDKLRGKMAGATDYLTKPFEPEILIKVINKYIN
jgi:twitching motility two-component system response regulator PilG